MVRAILKGTKTQTRRVIKPQPDAGLNPLTVKAAWSDGFIDVKCPYGQPGDRLWVRETWAIKQCGRRVSLAKEAWPQGWPLSRLQFQATDPAPAKRADGSDYWWNSRPSIHMPRWASRITLEITGVRVERLQEMSEADATAEGFGPCPTQAPDCTCVLNGFQILWHKLNAERAPWAANPWVWVLEFRRVQ